MINQLGVTGERQVIASYLAVLDSRLLLPDGSGNNALAMKNTGIQGSGKSYPIEKCLKIYPKSSYHLFTNASPKSLYYKKTGLQHKALIMAEGFQFQKDNNDTEVSYITRSLISEGQVRYLVNVKDKNDNWTPEEIVLEGPTSFITTTIKEELEEQLEDRLFTVHSNQTKDQTKKIIMTQAKLDAGIIQEIDEKTIRAYQEFQKNLSPCKVKIPFMPQVAEHFTLQGLRFF